MKLKILKRLPSVNGRVLYPGDEIDTKAMDLLSDTEAAQLVKDGKAELIKPESPEKQSRRK